MIPRTNSPFFRLTLATVIVAAVGVRPAPAQSTVVVPNTQETNGLNTPIRSMDRTYQSYYNQSVLASITEPVNITGVRYRLSQPLATTAASSYPSQPITFSSYTIQLSRPSAAIDADGEIISLTPTFAANQDPATRTTVRSGPLTIEAGAFTQLGIAGTANPFGPTIDFSTPYRYTPGTGLMFTVGLSGYTPASEPQDFLASADFENGVADAVSSTNGNNFNSSPNGFSSPLIVEFTFAPVPEPATVLAVAAGGLGAAGWVRRRIRA